MEKRPPSAVRWGHSRSVWGSKSVPLLRISALHMVRNPAARPDGMPSDEFARVLATAAISDETSERVREKR